MKYAEFKRGIGSKDKRKRKRKKKITKNVSTSLATAASLALLNRYLIKPKKLLIGMKGGYNLAKARKTSIPNSILEALRSGAFVSKYYGKQTLKKDYVSLKRSLPVAERKKCVKLKIF